MDSSTDTRKTAGNPRTHLRRRGRVRIVGWIRPFHEKEVAERPEPAASSESGLQPTPPLERPQQWISVLRPSGDHALIVLGGQEEAASASRRTESYTLDWCYEQEEDISEIFSREVKPLLEWVFHGFNASILAYGARDSGKTRLIEGCDDKPGLAFLAMHEVLARGEKNGSEVMISLYEVHQDRVFDLINDQEVQVLEDAGAKVQLKGLSQVTVQSIQEFRRLYYGCNQQTPLRKDVTTVKSRRHKGLIIYIPCFHDKFNASLVGGMNIIDLAGYEDTKHKKTGPHLIESFKINKSLYALQNVVSALNADGRVPYRESKFTHLLKDFVNREGQALMITCLKPTPCLDTAQVVSISSRSCLAVNSSHSDSIKKKSGQRPIPCHSPSSDQRPIQLPSAGREKSLSISMTKPGIPRFGTNKTNAIKSLTVERKLFNTRGPFIISAEDKPFRSVVAGKESLGQEGQDKSTSIADVLQPSIQSLFTSNAEALELSTQDSIQTDEQLNLKDVNTISQLNWADTSRDHRMEGTCGSLDAETRSSPPISERLREISNTLKLLSCQPLSIIPHEKDVSCSRRDEQDGTDSMDPKTPLGQSNFGASGMWDAGKSGTPKEMFKARAGFKNSMVQECLKFLNTASKEELKEVKGIGEKRLSYILELREESPMPFKELDDLQKIGLAPKQAKGLVRSVVTAFFK